MAFLAMLKKTTLLGIDIATIATIATIAIIATIDLAKLAKLAIENWLT